MSEASGCSGNCSSCSSKGSCSKPQSLLEPANHLSEVKKVIGIVSGKGGVGKSMVTSSLAVMMQRRGFSTAILDADITGPSIPKMFGITGRAQGTELGIDPRLTSKGTEVMSVNLLLENTDDPVVWRHCQSANLRNNRAYPRPSKERTAVVCSFLYLSDDFGKTNRSFKINREV